MSVKAVKWALRSAPLSPTKTQARDRLVLAALANYHSSETGACYPAASTLAEDLELGLSGIRRALKSLEGQGLISRTDQSEVSHIRAGSRPIAWHLHLEKSRGARDENYFDDPVSDTVGGVHVGTTDGHSSDVTGGVHADTTGGVHADTTGGVHVETQKGNLKGIIKGKNPPVVPPRGDAPAPAKTEPENPSKEIEPAGKQKPAKRNDRGSRLEDGWMPSQKVIDQMRQECPHVNLEYEHRKFTDYWLSVPASRGRKSNWDATWRNWIRRASESRTGGNTPPQETFDYYADMLIQEHRAQQAANSGQIVGQTQWELP